VKPHHLQLGLGALVLAWILGSAATFGAGNGKSLLRRDLDRSLEPPSVAVLRALTDRRPPAEAPRGRPAVGGFPATAEPEERRGFGGWLGTDTDGRSLAYLLLAAPGFYLRHGLLYVALATATLLAVGVATGYAPRSFPGRAASWIVESNHALPQLLVIFAVLSITDTRMTSLVVGLAVISGLAKSILIRNKIEKTRSEDFLQGLREMGLSHAAIVGRHLVRTHLRALLLVLVPFLLAELVLFEACVGYLERPVDVRDDLSFGALLFKAVNVLGRGQEGTLWVFAFPAAGIVVLVWGLYALGSGLAHAFQERNPYSL